MVNTTKNQYIDTKTLQLSNNQTNSIMDSDQLTEQYTSFRPISPPLEYSYTIKSPLYRPTTPPWRTDELIPINFEKISSSTKFTLPLKRKCIYGEEYKSLTILTAEPQAKILKFDQPGSHQYNTTTTTPSISTKQQSYNEMVYTYPEDDLQNDDAITTTMTKTIHNNTNANDKSTNITIDALNNNTISAADDDYDDYYNYDNNDNYQEQVPKQPILLSPSLHHQQQQQEEQQNENLEHRQRQNAITNITTNATTTSFESMSNISTTKSLKLTTIATTNEPILISLNATSTQNDSNNRIQIPIPTKTSRIFITKQLDFNNLPLLCLRCYGTRCICNYFN